jgi:predicted RNA-binding Zn-ribbon protein involved in translation (DUF1610 family)
MVSMQEVHLPEECSVFTLINCGSRKIVRSKVNAAFCLEVNMGIPGIKVMSTTTPKEPDAPPKKACQRSSLNLEVTPFSGRVTVTRDPSDRTMSKVYT